MGLLQTLGFKSAEKPAVEAQYAPAVMSTQYGFGSYNTGVGTGYNSGIDRNFALQVASVSRCRNLIAGVVSSIDLALYKKSTGEKLGSPIWLEQPDVRQPRSVTIAATVDSLIFFRAKFLGRNFSLC
jgi:hypothetical protein